MNTLDSMRQKLQPMGLYNLDEDSLVSEELEVYAKALDEVTNRLVDLERECFLQTAEGVGLSRKEQVLGRVRNDLPRETRAQMLLFRSAVSEADFSKGSVESALKAAGVHGEIFENPNDESLVVNCLEVLDETTTEENLATAVAEFLPAHLDWEMK